MQGVSKVRFDFFFVRISLIIKNTFWKTWLGMLFIIHLTLNTRNIANQNVFLVGFSKWWGIECTSSQSVSKDTLFQAKHSHCLSSSSYLGTSFLYVFSSTIIQMVSRGFTSREFASRSPFAIKFQILLTPCLHVRPLFLFKAFQPLLVIFLRTVVLETLTLWS